MFLFGEEKVIFVSALQYFSLLVFNLYKMDVQQGVTLEGSCDTLCEYLDYALNLVLYQRGIYKPEQFVMAENYGISLLMLKENTDAKNRINDRLHYIKKWLKEGRLNSVTLTIVDKKSHLILEQWEFTMKKNLERSSKCFKRIRKEIQDVMRQIISTVSILPTIDNPCNCHFSFNGITVADFPPHWGVSYNVKPNGTLETIQLRSFSTGLHNMSTAVSYSPDLDP